MEKRARIIAIGAVTAFSILVLTSPSNPIPLPGPPGEGSDSVEILAENLDKPRAIAVHGDRAFVTEKDGRIRVIENGTLLEAPLASFRTVDEFDAGLLGIALHPDFGANGLLYVFVSYEEDGLIWNKIVMITEEDNRLAEARTVLDRIPGSKFTNGGFVKFGPDGKLYAGTGTVSDASHLPQDPGSLAGKILRINDDGTIPDDNPWEGSPVYSIGHRNPQGMTWDGGGNLLAAEFGPEKNDEINMIRAGANYGWPEQECAGGGFEDAVLCYDPSIEPGGILFYPGGALGVESPFVMASMRAYNLYQLDFGEGLASQSSILSGVGRIRDVVSGEDGSLYVITSNTDGKGFADPRDDKLLRIVG